MENRDIERLDIVEYTDVGVEIIDGKRKVVKVFKRGRWDGEKVILDCPERTTVRKKEWLTLVQKIPWICYFDTNNKNLLIFEDKKERKSYIAIPPGNNRIDLIDASVVKLGGYLYKFNGIVVITSNNTRLVFHKGVLLTEIKL